ncbi:MAG: hypothetical protein BWY31_03237 [Lentisphaerae bacterium ADurb.Bin242]|nr:MAG: hypothetical protein BWY31_03237 [Lentisphaerae bacterium ADurb.Bin242]
MGVPGGDEADILPGGVTDFFSGNELSVRVSPSLDPREDGIKLRVDFRGAFSGGSDRKRGDPEKVRVLPAAHGVVRQITGVHSQFAGLERVSDGTHIRIQRGIAVLKRSVGVPPRLHGQPQVEFEGDGGLARAECGPPLSVRVLNHGLAARGPDIRQEVPGRLGAGRHADSIFAPGGVRDFPGEFQKLVPVFRRLFRVESRVLENILPPEKRPCGNLARRGPDVFPRRQPAHGGTVAEKDRNQRLRSFLQETRNVFVFRIMFDIFVERPEKVLPDVGVGHPEVENDHVRRRIPSNGENQTRLFPQILDGNAVELRQFDLRIPPLELFQDFEPRPDFRIGGFRIRKIHHAQRNFLLRAGSFRLPGGRRKEGEHERRASEENAGSYH